MSLLPSATEIVFALGLGDSLVGISHMCDYPAAARGLPVVSRSIRSKSHLSSAEMDVAPPKHENRGDTCAAPAK